MTEYELSPGAENDLYEIALYTIQTWGVEQADRYQAALKSHFRALGCNGVPVRVFLRRRPELRVSHCEHHYVFFLLREGDCPLILALFHEKMD